MFEDPLYGLGVVTYLTLTPGPSGILYGGLEHGRTANPLHRTTDDGAYRLSMIVCFILYDFEEAKFQGRTATVQDHDSHV
jgi:hypothetical protein